MVKYLISLLLIIFSLNVFADATKTLNDGSELYITDRLHQISWYKLPGWNHNGYPKYSGALGTYTAKHAPIAVNANGVDYYTFSQNHTGDLDIFIADSLGNKTLIHTTPIYTDPHDNAVVNVIDGYIYVVVAARSNARIGTAYKSKNRYDISEFELINTGWWAYPQLWENALLYTDYSDTPSQLRELWVTNRYCNKKLVSKGHYGISNYDGEYLHLTYNYHTYDDLNRRQHIFYMRSRDGCNWEDKDGVALTLPLDGYSQESLIWDSDDEYVYMKDIEVINGEVHILTVNASSFYPDEGTKELYLTKLDGTRIKITDVGHNYNTGSFMDGYIVTPTFGDFGYAGGDIEVFNYDGTQQLKANFSYMYNYCRKVYKGSGCYVGEAQSSINNYGGAHIRKITIN